MLKPLPNIKASYPAFDISTTTLKQALEFAQKEGCRFLLTLDQGKYYGLLPVQVLESLRASGYSDEMVLRELDPQLFLPISASPDIHLYEALDLLDNYELDFLPLIGPERELLGVFDKENLFSLLVKITKANLPGGIVVIECHFYDYSLTRIASIIESENAHIMSLTVQSLPESDRIRLVLKLDIEELSRVVLSLERFGYEVVYYASRSPQLLDLSERLAALLRYLNP